MKCYHKKIRDTSKKKDESLLSCVSYKKYEVYYGGKVRSDVKGGGIHQLGQKLQKYHRLNVNT